MQHTVILSFLISDFIYCITAFYFCQHRIKFSAICTNHLCRFLYALDKQALLLYNNTVIGVWRSLVSRSVWDREISQVRILSPRPQGQCPCARMYIKLFIPNLFKFEISKPRIAPLAWCACQATAATCIMPFGHNALLRRGCCILKFRNTLLCNSELFLQADTRHYIPYAVMGRIISLEHNGIFFCKGQA